MVISLDFELMWGILDHGDPMSYSDNIRNVFEVIPRLLDVFSIHGIHATWGVVGLLTEGSIDNCLLHMPDRTPSYRNNRLSPYDRMEGFRDVERKLLFAPELVEQIAQTEGQEIASHTYSHYYCEEIGQTEAEFEADLVRAEQTTGKYAPNVCSLIFPRNQFNEEYADVLKRTGFHYYRGNEHAWFYRPQDNKGDRIPLKRAFRLLDNYLPISGSNTYDYDEIVDSSGLCNIRSSRFLRPYSKTLFWLEPIRMRRIATQMEYAAKHNRVFHLWWHPHNFGSNMEENFSNLGYLLERYASLNIKYCFRSMNMRELGELVL
jgi:peptidoglycan/xylan/chitin deacetylase (PgdA/CDA1 family)